VQGLPFHKEGLHGYAARVDLNKVIWILSFSLQLFTLECSIRYHSPQAVVLRCCYCIELSCMYVLQILYFIFIHLVYCGIVYLRGAQSNFSSKQLSRQHPFTHLHAFHTILGQQNGDNHVFGSKIRPSFLLGRVPDAQ
jgi:hypothetical protein